METFDCYYVVLMSDIARSGKWEEAKDLLIAMKKRRVKHDALIYNILFNHLFKDGRTTDAYKFFVEMQV